MVKPRRRTLSHLEIDSFLKSADISFPIQVNAKAITNPFIPIENENAASNIPSEQRNIIQDTEKRKAVEPSLGLDTSSVVLSPPVLCKSQNANPDAQLIREFCKVLIPL